MSWNYRIVRYRENQGFGLHEVYYDEAGAPTGMTAKPTSFACGVEEGPEGVRRSLAMAYTDARNRPIFDEPETWTKETAEIQE